MRIHTFDTTLRGFLGYLNPQSSQRFFSLSYTHPSYNLSFGVFRQKYHKPFFVYMLLDYPLIQREATYLYPTLT